MDTAARIGWSDPAALRFAARVPTVIWLMLLLAASYGLAAQLAGKTAGAVIVIALSLDPNIVAHGSLVTVDIVFALATVLVLWASLRFHRSWSWQTSAVLGAALGFALTAKFTGMLLVPCALLIPAAVGVAPARHRRRPLRVAACMALMSGVCWLMICASYGFIGMGTSSFAGFESGAGKAVASSMPWLIEIFPIDFLTGIDNCIADERNTAWNAVILQTTYPDGVWFYFPLLWLVKTPLLLLGAALTGAIVALRRSSARAENRAILATGAVMLAYFCLVFRTQVGYRYVLMCVPLLYILAAQGLAHLLARRSVQILAAVALVATVAESSAFAGNPLSFTNVAVWDKSRAYEIVADSNLDWGQNAERVRQWAAAQDRHVAVDPQHLVPGINVVTINLLTGVFGEEQYAWVRDNWAPDDHLYYSHAVFYVDPRRMSELLAETRTVDYRESQRCSTVGEPERLDERESTVLGRPHSQRPSLLAAPVERPTRGRRVCLKFAVETDVSFTGVDGTVNFGLLSKDGECREQFINEHQTIWLRFPPGSYAVCLPRGETSLRVERGQMWSLASRPDSSPLRPEPPEVVGTGR